MKGTIQIGLTVDGFIAGKDGNIDWLNDQPQIEGEDFGFTDFMKSVDVMVMGRNTFDTVVAFGKDMWAYGDDIPIVVWTRNVANVKIPDWLRDKDNNILIKSSPSAQALWEELQEKQYTMVYVDGGKTIRSFLKAGLIHRLHLTRIPILLGEGIPLFGGGEEGGMPQQALKHVSTKSYSNGFVVSVYDVESAEETTSES
jgi:dihydrofolate reductase